MSEAERAVQSALAAADIAPHPDEIVQLVERYPAFREMMAKIYAVEEADETFPELIFDARTP